MDNIINHEKQQCVFCRQWRKGNEIRLSIPHWKSG